MKSNIRQLLQVLPATKKSLFLILVLFLLSSMLEVFGIGVIGPFISIATDPSEIQQNVALEWIYQRSGAVSEEQFVIAIGGAILLIYFMKTIAVYLTQVVIIKFSDRQQKLLILKLVRKYFEASYIYHTRKNSSSIIDGIIEIANKFTTTILMPMLTTTSNIIVSSCLFLFLLSQSSISVFIFLVALFPIILGVNYLKPRVIDWGKQVRKSKEGIIKYVNHGFGGVKEVKIIGCESYFEGQISEMVDLLESSHVKFSSFQIVPRYLMELVMVMCVIITINISLFRGNEGDLISTLGIFALSSFRLIPSISNSINGINKLRNSSYTMSQICLELSDLQLDQATLEEGIERAAEVSKAVDSSDLSGSLEIWNSPNELHSLNQAFLSSAYYEISVDKISYRYRGADRYAVKNVSLNINRGESIAFVGKSGSGKTTLADIILGLLVPQVGDIKVDCYSIYDHLPAWQSMVGYIPQSIFLIDDTVQNNIAFGVPKHEINASKLNEAIKLAQLTDVVEGLPNGLQTFVGERGVLLSGGQRQRIGIARCLYHDREILVLDEATAALDNETERLVTEAISMLGGSKTLITIAHRLSTIEQCDCIYQLENGEIIHSGSYQEVSPHLVTQ